MPGEICQRVYRGTLDMASTGTPRPNARSHNLGRKIIRTRLGVVASLLIVIGGFSGAALAESSASNEPEKIIIDTDIGTDIDGAFAVALALRSPEFDILGIATASGDTDWEVGFEDRARDYPFLALIACGKRSYALSDKTGRRPLMIACASAILLLTYPALSLLGRQHNLRDVGLGASGSCVTDSRLQRTGSRGSRRAVSP